MDDIITGAPLGPRVLTVVPMDDFKLLLTFNNGEKRVFDAKPLFLLNAFRALQNKAFFETVKVAYGSVVWENDIDYCPDTLYAESVVADEIVTTSNLSAVAESKVEYRYTSNEDD